MASTNFNLLNNASSIPLYLPKSQHFIETDRSSISSSSSSLSSLNSGHSENRLKSIDYELKSIKLQISKNESLLLRENNKLNSNSSQIERHGINLVEWENFMNMKISQMNQFADIFKQSVHYSNKEQLNRQLFQNRAFVDLNSELFAFEEKINYLSGIIFQLQSVAKDIKSKIVDLTKNQDELKAKESLLLSQFNRAKDCASQ